MNRYIKSVCVVLVLLLAQNVAAQGYIRPKISLPNDLWANSYNGVLFFERTDMEASNTEAPMSLLFYYNSSSNNTNYGYGPGFSLGNEFRCRVDDDRNVTIISGDGQSDIYTRYGDEYGSPAGVFSTVAEYKENKFVLKHKTGECLYFDSIAHGKVTRMLDRNGNETVYTYNSDALLVRISDGFGHSIDLVYEDSLLTKATASFYNGSMTYQYDEKKRLVKCTDAVGNVRLYRYTKEDRIEEIIDANGNRTQIAYNSSGMVSRVRTAVSDKSIRYDGDKTVFVDYTAPHNEYSFYRWDHGGRAIEKVGLCCGVQAKFEYDTHNNIVKEYYPNGTATEYTYDERGNMLSLTDALGNSEYYTYDEVYNLVTSFKDKNGNLYNFAYDAKGNLLSISGPLGIIHSFTYNDKGWPVTITDAGGNVTATTYNNDGTIASSMDAAGNVTSYDYDSYGNMVSSQDARGFVTRYSYDRLGRLVSQTDPLGRTIKISYDKVGNVVRVLNEKNQITAYTYDAEGHLLTLTDPAGGKYSYTYDGKGNILSAKDPAGDVYRYTWNESNKLLSQTNPAGEKTEYDYDAGGNLSAVFHPNGNVTEYFYDALDRVIQVGDNLGIIAKYTYDGNGNKLSVTDGLDRTVTYTYDALNRCVAETLPSGAVTRYVYDANSNLLSVTDAKGNVSKYTYSSLGQCLTSTDALNAVTRFEYDANGNLSRATDANGNATTYAYDAMDRNTVITFADGRSLQHTYDELGNIVASKDRAGREFKYAYDHLGNMLSKSYPDGTADKFTYDAVGRMLSATNKNAVVEHNYDKAGRLLSETLNGKTVAYNYDIAAGKRILTYPSGMKVEERLNARSLITTILQNGNEAVTMTYNAAGQVTQHSYANGIVTGYSYNNNGWLQEIKDDHDIMHLQMTYDAVGYMTKRDDRLNTERSESYGYDVIGRLTSFKRGPSVETNYQFDPLGNRTKVAENGITTAYTSNSLNAYTRISGAVSFTPQYDANGNMLNDSKYAYKYDYNNRLVGVDEVAGIYKYDALGRRIAKNGTLYYYVGDQMVEEVTDGIVTSYLFGNGIDETFQMKRGDEVYYYHTNHLGSTMALSDEDGALKERVEYDAYGAPAFYNAEGKSVDGSLVGNNILFTGREYDAETGNYYFRARTLHTGLGRFMQKDPLMYVDGMNDYLYVKDTPINFSDPYGQVAVAVAIPLLGKALVDVAAFSLLLNAVSPTNGTSRLWQGGGNYRGPCWDPTTRAFWTKACECVREPKKCCRNSIFDF